MAVTQDESDLTNDDCKNGIDQLAVKTRFFVDNDGEGEGSGHFGDLLVCVYNRVRHLITPILLCGRPQLPGIFTIQIITKNLALETYRNI